MGGWGGANTEQTSKAEIRRVQFLAVGGKARKAGSAL